MDRRITALASLALGAALLAPVSTLAGSPAGALGPVLDIDTQSPDACVPSYTLNLCDRPGGLVSKGQNALLVTWSGGDIVQYHSTDGTASWSAGGKLGGANPTMPAIASDGDEIAYAYLDDGLAKPVRFSHAFGIHALNEALSGFKAPRMVTTKVAADVENGVYAYLAAGYDEVPSGRPGSAIRIHVETDGIGFTPVTTTLAWNGLPCFVKGTDPSVAVTGDGVIVVAYWQTCDKLVVRRSKDFGETFSAAQTLSTRSHELGMAIEAEGKVVVIAYAADGKVFTRRSTDNGKTWGAAVQAGSGARSLRLTYQAQKWHLLSAGTTSIRYRSSASAGSWSTGETIDTEPSARTYALGVGVTGGDVVAAYAIRLTAADYGLYSALR